MTLEIVKNIVGLFTTEPMAPEFFSTRYDDASLKLFMQRYAEKDFESLRGFKKVIGDGTMGLQVQNGIAQIPDDFFAMSSAYYKKGETTVPINFVEDRTYDLMIGSKIEFPTDKFPIGNLQSNYIRIRPSTVKYVTLSYFVKPTPVTYAVTDTSGYLEFDADNSSEVFWNEANIVVIIQFILQAMGLNVDKTDIQSKLTKPNN